MKILMLGHECQHFTLKRIGTDELAYVPYASPWGRASSLPPCMPSQVTIFQSLAEAIKDFHPDLAVIGVPNTTKNYFDIEKTLLDNGVPILEYKLRLDRIEDLRDFITYQGRQNVPVCVGDPYVYRDCVRVLRRDLASWKLGQPEYLRWRCVINGEPNDWMRTYQHVSLEDLGLHHFSVLHSLFDLRHAAIQARSLSPRKGEYLTGTVCESWLEWPDGLYVSHSIDWVHTMDGTDWLGTIALECENGGVYIQNEKIFVRAWGAESQEIPIVIDPLDPLEEMIAWLKNDNPPEALRSIQDFAPVMETINRALYPEGRKQ